jgi:prefoldin subunit 5
MAQTIEELSEQIELIKKGLSAIQSYAESQGRVNSAIDERFEGVEEAINALLSATRKITGHMQDMALDIQQIKAKMGM